jgi:dihydrofolate reductase
VAHRRRHATFQGRDDGQTHSSSAARPGTVFPKKPLPGRTNIVVTRDRAFAAEGAVVVHSLDDALAHAQSENPAEIVIAGGADIYEALRDRADRIYLTEVHAAFEGDANARAVRAHEWRETAREDHATPEGLRYSFVTLERARLGPCESSAPR